MTQKSITEISSVPYYGRPFPLIPRSLPSRLKVAGIFAKHLYKTIGLLPFLTFWLLVPFRAPGVLSKYKEGLKLMQQSFGAFAKMQWTLLILLYETLENRFDKAKAYAYAKEAMQESSHFLMNEFYQADILATFDDPYLAFWEYHKAMFLDDPKFENELIEEADHKKMVVYNCRNCAIAKLSIPELAPLGCDHDITGFEAIADKIQMDFRRPTTLAKDGQPCQFMFFRKGTAPAGLETK